MNILPRINEAIIPLEKFTKYALNPDKAPDKALAFHLALGYDLKNVEQLIVNIEKNLDKFPAILKGNKGYGNIYEVNLVLTGANGKNANVLTGWIDDIVTGEMRLTSVYIGRKRGKRDD